MAGENIQLEFPNLSYGPDSGFYYSLDSTNGYIIKKNAAGTTVASYPLDTTIRTPPIRCLDYDGYYFYSMEDMPSDLGTMIRKWRYDGATWRQTRSYNLVNRGGHIYDSQAFCFETHNTTGSTDFGPGVVSIPVNNTSGFVVGEEVKFGPSTRLGYEGNTEVKTIQSVVGGYITVDSALSSAYTGNTDRVTTAPYFWLFSDGWEGSLYQFRSSDYNIMAIYSGGRYSGVTACCMYSGDIAFVRGGSILVADLGQPDLDLIKNGIRYYFKSDYTTSIPVYDMLYNSVDDAFYLLQMARTIEDAVTGALSTNNWDSYNYVSYPIATLARTLNMRQSQGRMVSGAGTTNTLTAQVLSQWGTSLSGQTVNFYHDGDGSLSTSQGVTDPNGEVSTVYTTGSLNEVVEFDGKILATKAGYSNGFSVGITPSAGEVTQTKPTVGGSGSIINQYKDRLSATYGITDRTDPMGVEFEISQPRELLEDGIEITTLSTVASAGLTQLYDSVEVRHDGITLRPAPESNTTIEQFNFVLDAIPTPYSIKIPISTNIWIRIGDPSYALDPSTLIFKVNGVDVTSLCTVTDIIGGLEVLYNPLVDFDYGSRVTVQITISDTDSPANTVVMSYYFDIVEDYVKPFITNVTPASGATGVDTTPTIQFDVLDYGSGVDSSSIEMFVEGLKVTPDSITAITNGYRVSYTPSDSLPYETEISVAVIAYDLSDYQNSMFQSWMFTTEESTPPWFRDFLPEQCEVLVDPRTGIVIEVYGLEDGIDETSVEMKVDNETKTITLTPKIYRRS